jgi:hypothetical protein
MTQPVLFATTPLEGIDFAAVYTGSVSLTPEYPAPPFALGTIAEGSDGTIFMYVKAFATINQFDFVTIDHSYNAYQIAQGTPTGDGFANIVGCAQVAAVATNGLWVAIKGNAGLQGNMAAATAQGVALWTSATAGQLSSTSNSSTSPTVSALLNGVAVQTATTVSGPANVSLVWPDFGNRL